MKIEEQLDRFKKMTVEGRRAAALDTGERTVAALARSDPALARVLKEKNEIESWLSVVGGGGRYGEYNAMSNNQLVALAIALAQKLGCKGISELSKSDGPLYQVLRERSLTNHIGRHFCWPCRAETAPKKRPIRQHISRRDQYRALTDAELAKLLEDEDYGSISVIQRSDIQLYHEVASRPAVRRIFVDKGGRRPPVKWANLSMDQWIEIASQFNCYSDFNLGYVAAVANARKLGVLDELRKQMESSGKWEALRGMDGLTYDSRAEMIVFNLLHVSGFRYERHPLLPWADSRRAREADGRLLDSTFFIEVWAVSEAGYRQRSEVLPKWYSGYLRKRERKIKQYRRRELPLVQIEAEIYRMESLYPFVAHVVEQFRSIGVAIKVDKSIRYDVSSRPLGEDWAVSDFLAYAEKNDLVRLSDFQSPQHRDLYNLLGKKGLRKKVEDELNRTHKRAVRSCESNRIPWQKLRQICRKLGITTKSQYIEAHKARRLPDGAPASIRQTYGINFTMFFHERERGEFLPFEEARRIVRPMGLRSRAEFERAVKSDPRLANIRRNPNNRKSGGYPDFTTWPDFLGKDVGC
ncbi:hypothetical protein [Thioalkalivibrio sp. XN279]|uniref:hypothetical protein n=1 Tax=Thioalkalivibrio sp. XN279 TaxID=2714953 RepID=UPI00140AB5CF|nr:hypothetical protein [Thioalkalivibrio sp. XN279]NHA14620.1 hypothetical protein [Thioalkalivibrio sp. XN279]